MSTLRQQISRFKLIILLLLVVIVALGLLFANERNKNTGLPDIATIKVEKRDVIQTVTANGNIAGIDTREVFVPQSQVLELRVNEGDRVTQNQIVYLNKLNGKNFEVWAPINGIISDIKYKANDNVLSPAIAAFKVTDNSEYRINLEINENDVLNLAAGQKAALTFPAISLDKTYAGEVTYVSTTPLATGSTVNYKTTVKPTELPKEVRLGMSVDVEITTAQVDNVLAIPENYLIEKDNSYFAKLLKKTTSNNAETYETIEIKVEIGLRTDTYVEIKSGLKEGDEIVSPSFTVERKFGFF